MSAGLRGKLIELAEPLLGQLGYELVDLEFSPGRSHAQLRLFIDRPEGITVENCEQISREFSALLDVKDPIPTAYTLEVSSPGLDRVLRKPEHYGRFLGEQLHVELLAPRDGRRRYTGKLVSADEQQIEMQVDGVAVQIAYGDIDRARLVPQWPDTTRKR
jgi:ribosome maturation factor RimP